MGFVRRFGVELAVLLLADGGEQVELGLEEVDMAFLVLQQLLEQFHGTDVTQFPAGIVGLAIKVAGAVFGLKITVENFLDVLHPDIMELGKIAGHFVSLILTRISF